MTFEQKVSLEILDNVHNILLTRGSRGRRVGKTYYACEVLCGYLEVLGHETILVVVPNLERVQSFVQTLKLVLPKHGLSIKRVVFNDHRIFFNEVEGNIKFMSLYTLSKVHPFDFNINTDLYPIFDLDDMSPEFWQDDISVGDLHKMAKYFNPRYHL